MDQLEHGDSDFEQLLGDNRENFDFNTVELVKTSP
jgi:hypothetical protein